MIMTFGRFRRLSLVVLAAGAVASCGQMASSQLPVQSSNPSVTYKYRTDQELLPRGHVLENDQAVVLRMDVFLHHATIAKDRGCRNKIALRP